MGLWELIKESMLCHSNQLIGEEHIQLSYSKVINIAENIGEKLQGAYCCAIYCKSELANAIAILACFSAHITACPLSVRYGPNHCTKILEQLQPDIMITDEFGLEVKSAYHNGYIPPREHPALIMYTSGTTGEPKGIMLSEKNIVVNMMDIMAYFKIENDDTILISRPLYHCAVLTGEFLISLIKGVKIYFYSQKFNPQKILEIINYRRISTFCGTPTLISTMAKVQRTPGASGLKNICISGECLSYGEGKRIREAFPCSTIYHVYGLTEACPRVSYLKPDLFDLYPDCVGIPLRSITLKILNKNGQKCSVNEVGALWVKGDNIMIGYYSMPKRTSEVLKNGWLYTGDLACINEKGLLKIKGRADDLIIKAGMNIYPAEIEAILKRDHRVKEVVAYGYENRFGKHIGIKISGNFKTEREIRQLCLETLPSFEVPTLIELVPSICKNGSGKVIRGGQNGRT